MRAAAAGSTEAGGGRPTLAWLVLAWLGLAIQARRRGRVGPFETRRVRRAAGVRAGLRPPHPVEPHGGSRDAVVANRPPDLDASGAAPHRRRADARAAGIRRRGRRWIPSRPALAGRRRQHRPRRRDRRSRHRHAALRLDHPCARHRRRSADGAVGGDAGHAVVPARRDSAHRASQCRAAVLDLRGTAAAGGHRRRDARHGRPAGRHAAALASRRDHRWRGLPLRADVRHARAGAGSRGRGDSPPGRGGSGDPRRAVASRSLLSGEVGGRQFAGGPRGRRPTEPCTTDGRARQGGCCASRAAALDRRIGSGCRRREGPAGGSPAIRRPLGVSLGIRRAADDAGGGVRGAPRTCATCDHGGGDGPQRPAGAASRAAPVQRADPRVSWLVCTGR